MSQRQRQAPKREIETRNSKGVNLVSTSIQSVTLHTSSDKETLTRMIVDIDAVLSSLSDVDTVLQIDWQIDFRPNAKQVAENVANTDFTDRRVPKEELLNGTLLLNQNATVSGAMKSQAFDIDSAAQRKMKVGDKIVLTFIGDVASVGVMVHNIKSFYKQI